MRRMTRSQAKAFRDHWDTVASVQAEERRCTSLQLRWEQMNALRRLAVGLALPLTSPADQEEIVWERWARLKKVYRNSRDGDGYAHTHSRRF